MMQMQEAQLSLSLAGNASFSRWAANLFLFNDLRHRNRHSEGMFWLHFWGADRLRTLPPPHGFSNLYSPINASNKHLCLPLSLFNPSAFFFFFFPGAFQCSPFTPTHSALPPLPSPSPLPHPSIHLSIHPIWWSSQWNTWAIYKSIKAHSFQHAATREKEGEMEREGEVGGEVGNWRNGWKTGRSKMNKEGDILRATEQWRVRQERGDRGRERGRTESWTVRGEGEEEWKQLKKERASDRARSIEIGETKSAKGGGKTKD